jgi:DNA polymerase III subunit gamma/tau
VAEPLQRTPLGDRWYEIATRMAAAGGISALSRELAWQGGLQSVDESATPPRWTLCVERESLRAAPLQDKVAAALAAELGHPVALVVEAGVPADSPTRRDAAERGRRQAEAEAQVRADPVVQALTAQFKSARIVPGSIKPI